jgi:hypothetical protein
MKPKTKNVWKPRVYLYASKCQIMTRHGVYDVTYSVQASTAHDASVIASQQAYADYASAGVQSVEVKSRMLLRLEGASC